MVFSVSLESSPDPLIRSYDGTDQLLLGSSPIKATESRRTTQNATKAFQGSSPSLRRNPSPTKRSSPTKQHQTLIFNTPTKHLGGADGEAPSPWRIRVTVEAEPEHEQVSRSNRKAKNGVKVPLKGDSPAARPVKRRRSTRTVSLSADETSASPRVRSRKSFTPRNRRTNNTEEIGVVDSIEEVEEGRAEEQHDQGQNHTNLRSLNEQTVRNPFVGYQVDTRLDVPDPPIDWKIRNRVPTPRKPTGFDESTLSPLPDSSQEKESTSPDRKSPSIGRTSVFDTAVDSDDDDDDDVDSLSHQGEIITDDTAMIEKSLADSEGFSMVSIESLRNHRDQAERQLAAVVEIEAEDKLNKPLAVVDRPHQSGTTTQANPVKDKLEAGAPKPQASSKSALSRTTPPTESRAISAKDDTEDGQNGRLISDENARKRKHSSLDALADFHTGAKRLLGASYALGHVVAPNELRISSPAGSDHIDGSSKPPLNANHTEMDTKLPTPAHTSENSSSPFTDVQGLLTGRRSTYDEMSWEPTVTKVVTNDSRGGVQVPIDDRSLSSQSDAMKHFEAQCQKDREDVVRQAQGAKSAQIIDLDSENDNEDGSNGDSKEGHIQPTLLANPDIWLDEANNSMEDSMQSQASRSRRRPKQKTADPTPDLRELLGESRAPTKAKIPRTWRRESGHHFLYSDEIPSPIREAPKPLFEQDLETYMSLTDEDDQVDHEDEAVDRSDVKLTKVDLMLSPLVGLTTPVLETMNAEQPTPPSASAWTGKSRNLDASHNDTNDSDDDDYNDNGREEEVEEKRAFASSSGLLKSILSSPLRKAESRDPKEVHFGKDAIREFDDGDHGDQQYYSSDHSSASAGSDGDLNDSSELAPGFDGADDTIYAPDNSQVDDTTIVQTSDVRQLHREMAAKAGEGLANTSKQNSAEHDDGKSGVLRPDPKKIYEPLFSAWSPSKNSKAKQASTPQPATRLKDGALYIPPTLGVFTRLSSWLFPIKPTADRNHFLLLDHYFRCVYPKPLHVVQSAMAVQFPRDGKTPVVSAEGHNFPPDLASHVGKYLKSHDDYEKPTPRMKITPEHCYIALHFANQARDRGIPLLTDGDVSQPSDPAQYPKRDANGHVVRVKEIWDTWEVLRLIYGLWVRDVKQVMEETGADWPEEIGRA